MHKEIYINGMDWKRIKDDQGGLTLMITFRDYFSKEDYIELIKRNYYFLTTKEEFEDLQEENKLLKEYYCKNVSKYEELIEKFSNLQERIDKAIEYIEKESWYMYKDDEEVIDRTPTNKLLDILRGKNE